MHTVRVKLLKPWGRLPKGTVTEVGKSIGDGLVADGVAQIVEPKTGPKPARTKLAKPTRAKG